MKRQEHPADMKAARSPSVGDPWWIKLTPKFAAPLLLELSGPVAVMVTLEGHADKNGECWPGDRLIAEEIGLDVSEPWEECPARFKVQRWLRELEAKGWIRRENNPREHGRGLIVLVKRLAIGDPDLCGKPHRVDMHPVTDSAQSGRAPCAENRTQNKSHGINRDQGAKQEPAPPSRRGSRPGRITLPEWMPLEAWDDFEDNLQEIRGRHLTNAHRKALFGQIDTLRGQGVDVAGLLRDAVVGCWVDFRHLTPEFLQGRF